MMKHSLLRLITVVLLLCAFTEMQAQRVRQQKVKEPEVAYGTDVNQHYAHLLDSLVAQKRELDSLRALLKGYESAGRRTNDNPLYYRLFSPLKLYRGTLRQWSLYDGQTETQNFTITDAYNDSVSQQIDRTLLDVYLKHPELVQGTEDQLLAEQSLRTDVYQPEQPNEKLSKGVETVAFEALPEALHMVIEKPNFWTFKSELSLQFSQVHFSENWYKGGENYNSMQGQVTLQLNYNNKEKWQIDNKLEMKLGFQTTTSDEYHDFIPNSDLLRLTNTFSLRASHKWYYSLKNQMSTQFHPGYRANNPKVYSDFMSPFNIVLSLGMEYKYSGKKFSCSANFSPIAYNYCYVDRKNLAPSFGVEGDHHSYNHWGPNIVAECKWNITSSINWQSRFYWFSDLASTNMEWENTINFQLTRFLSTKLFLHPRIDDRSTSYKNEKDQYLMFKEMLSFGFNFSF